MKISEKEMLWAYFINEEQRLDDEATELRNRIRFRRITVEDNVEMMLLTQRQADFREFTSVVLRLLHMCDDV